MDTERKEVEQFHRFKNQVTCLTQEIQAFSLTIENTNNLLDKISEYNRILKILKIPAKYTYSLDQNNPNLIDLKVIWNSNYAAKINKYGIVLNI